MKPSFRPLILAAAVLAAAPMAALAADAIPAEQAVRFVGKDGMVCGKVEKTRYAENAEGTPTFLYMGGAFPRHTFSARIPGDQRGKFKPTPRAGRPRRLRDRHDHPRRQPRRDRGDLAVEHQAGHHQVIAMARAPCAPGPPRL